MEDIVHPDIPFNPHFIKIRHPANNEAFFLLPANNVQQAPVNKPCTFGVHHLTALTTCQILTNETGYLSLSGDCENAESVVSTDSDGILNLNQYYYHLINPQRDLLYPICFNFSLWHFPHGQLSQAWDRTVPLDDNGIVAPDNWSVLSAMVRITSNAICLVGAMV